MQVAGDRALSLNRLYHPSHFSVAFPCVAAHAAHLRSFKAVTGLFGEVFVHNLNEWERPFCQYDKETMRQDCETGPCPSFVQSETQSLLKLFNTVTTVAEWYYCVFLFKHKEIFQSAVNVRGNNFALW